MTCERYGSPLPTLRLGGAPVDSFRNPPGFGRHCLVVSLSIRRMSLPAEALVGASADRSRI